MLPKNSFACPFEHIKNPDQEADKISEIVDRTISRLDSRYPIPDKVLRGVHPKSHGCVKASFEINSDIAPSMQVGLFSLPGKKFNAFIRFSNAAATLGPDISDKGEHGSRGIAIKVFDVADEVLVEDEDGACNQDFLMINQPVFAFANTDDYLHLMRVLDRNNDNPDEFFSPLKLQDPTLTEQEKQKILNYIKAENIDQQGIQRMLNTLTIVKQIKSTAVANPLNIQYFSAAPFLFGQDRVMKYSVKPVYQISPTVLPTDLAVDYLRRALSDSMSQNDRIEFDFMVQLRNGDSDMGIENASSIWDEKQFPFIKLAKIIIPTPQREVNSDANKAQCEAMAFTPWHSLPEHQPIGSINRLRKDVYQSSAEYRNKEREFKNEFFIAVIFKKIVKLLFG